LSYLIDIAALLGLLIFSCGCASVYAPLGPIMFGLGIMLFAIKLSSVKTPKGGKQ
jgi:hypothetical protein